MLSHLTFLRLGTPGFTHKSRRIRLPLAASPTSFTSGKHHHASKIPQPTRTTFRNRSSSREQDVLISSQHPSTFVHQSKTLRQAIGSLGHVVPQQNGVPRASEVNADLNPGVRRSVSQFHAHHLEFSDLHVSFSWFIALNDENRAFVPQQESIPQAGHIDFMSSIGPEHFDNRRLGGPGFRQG